MKPPRRAKEIAKNAARSVFNATQRKGFKKLPRGVVTFQYKLYNNLGIDWGEIESVRKKFGFTDIILFHGVAMERHGKAVVVSGPHGIGKSTTMRSLERNNIAKSIDDGVIIIGQRGNKLFVLETGTYHWRKKASIASKFFRFGSRGVFAKGKPLDKKKIESAKKRVYVTIALPSELVASAALKDRSNESFEPREIELRKIVLLPHPQDIQKPRLIHGNKITEMDYETTIQKIPKDMVTTLKPSEPKLRKRLKDIMMET